MAAIDVRAALQRNLICAKQGAAFFDPNGDTDVVDEARDLLATVDELLSAAGLALCLLSLTEHANNPATKCLEAAIVRASGGAA